MKSQTYSNPNSLLQLLVHLEGETKAIIAPSVASQSWQSFVKMLTKSFPWWLLVVNCIFAMMLVCVEYGFQPEFRYDDVDQWRVGAYLLMMGLCLCVTLMANGVQHHVVFVGFLTVAVATNLIAPEQALQGFASKGVWVPQLMLIIVAAIRDSGVLEQIIGRLLGQQPQGTWSPYFRLYWAVIALSALIGLGPTVSFAAPFVIRWARSGGYRHRPLLYLLVVAATCGNTVFLTSAPNSLAIREIICQGSSHDGACDFDVMHQTPLALALSTILGIWSVFAGQRLASSNGDESAQAQKQPVLTRERSGFEARSLEIASVQKRSHSRHTSIGSNTPSHRMVLPPVVVAVPDAEFASSSKSMNPGNVIEISAGTITSEGIPTKDTVIEEVRAIAANILETSPRKAFGAHSRESSTDSNSGHGDKRAPFPFVCAGTNHISCNSDVFGDRDAKRYYLIDFVVLDGSVVCGHTPKSLGIELEGDIRITTISRSARLSPELLPQGESAKGDTEMVPEHLREQLGCAADMSPAENQAGEQENDHADAQVTIASWRFQPNDIISAMCSTAGVCHMRQYARVFVMRGLRCHHLLGGRRHERRLFEAVVTKCNDLIGTTIDELLGLADARLAAHSRRMQFRRKGRQRSSEQIRTEELRERAPWFVQFFRGYPVAARRAEDDFGIASNRPLDPSVDVLQDGDVLLIDAFEEFPTLESTTTHFSVTSQVPSSMAPRHTRAFDRARGFVAIGALMLVVLLEDLSVKPIFVGSLAAVFLLIVVQAVNVNMLVQILNWPLLLSIGAGEGMAAAIRHSGVAHFIGTLIYGGTFAKLCFVSVLAQVAAVGLTPVSSGLLIAPLTLAAFKEDGLTAKALGMLVVVSCNMVSTPPPLPNSALRQKPNFVASEFLWWRMPVQVLATMTVVIWTFFSGVSGIQAGAIASTTAVAARAAGKVVMI